MRINHSADDAAGLAISSRLNSDARVFSQAIRNANDGISALSIAEGSVRELSGILIRLKELAESASNGTLALSQRRSLDTEARELTDEYNRILGTTKFNRQKLIDGSLGELGIQLGYGANGRVSFGLGGGLDRQVNAFGFDNGSISNPAAAEIAVGDINNDGLDDYVVATTSNSIAAYVSNGEGEGGLTFTNTQTISLTGAAQTTLSDVNNDGKLDLLAYAGPGSVRVGLGNGDGTFQTLGSAYSANRISAMADFDGDGNIDFATGTGNIFINVWRGNGDGTFTNSGTSLFGGISIQGMAAGDINADGLVDIVNVSSTDSLVHLWINNGNGSFSASGTYASGTTPNGVTLGDFNHDGVMDIATSSTGDDMINVRLNNGDGTFGAMQSYAAGTNPSSLQSVDWDGDGYLDLVSIDADKVQFHRGLEDGTFESARTVDPITGQSFTITDLNLGDFNGDGVLDVTYYDSTGTNYANRLTQTSSESDIQRFNLTTRQEALNSIDLIEAAFARITEELGSIGSAQSRLGSALRTLAASRENFLAAASRITDVEVANEAALLVNHQIRQQVAASVMAQANLIPRLVLGLLETR